MVDRPVVGDAIEPRQHLVLARERPERLVRLREHVLREVVGRLGVAAHPEDEGVDARLVRDVHRLEGGLM